MSYHDEELTRGPLRPPLRAVSQPPESDELHTLGLLMAATARIETRLRDLETLPREVHQLRNEIRDDRAALVHGASKHAANHSSNRLAALMTALFTLYEISSPYLRELWAMVRK